MSILFKDVHLPIAALIALIAIGFFLGLFCHEMDFGPSYRKTRPGRRPRSYRRWK